MGTSKHPNKKQTFLGLFFIDVSNEPKSVPARDLDDCRDNLRNSRSVFLIVENINNRLRYKAHY